MVTPEMKVVADPKAVATLAAQRIAAAAEAAIETRGSFSLILAGGNTPKDLYALLATPEVRDSIDWTRVHLFFSDERCVSPDDAESNYRMVRESLLAKVPVPGDNVYRIHGEADPAQAAQDYDDILTEYFADRGPDVALLGMGEDGHTASLFPHTQALIETDRLCVSNFVPRKNNWRITLTAPLLNRVERVMVLVAGAAKAVRVAQVLEGPRVPHELPIQLIQPVSGHLVWIMDAAAAGM